MIFKTLKDKCEYYRSLVDYRLQPNGYVLLMVDGKNFSRLIKDEFDKPFDDWFINTMNNTAIHICKELQACRLAFVQSDEISFLIKDTTESTLPFDGRLCKLQSVVASMATSYFTKEIIKKKGNTEEDYLFDCKAWSVPNFNEARAWFIYRQNDCIRNSKQQFCQTYCTYEELLRKTADEQVKICLEKTGKDWNKEEDGRKYGRFIYKDEEAHINQDNETYFRSVWKICSKENYEIQD